MEKMTDDDSNFIMKMSIIWIIGVLLAISIIVIGVYQYHKLSIDNFQKTILNLSDEQKCLHICGFQFGGNYLENYKFCAEKCDRISERAMENK